MSRTIRRKQFSSKRFLFDHTWTDNNGFIINSHDKFNSMHITVANQKSHAWYHSDCFCAWRSPGISYRKAYRAKSSMQLRNQLKLNDYEAILIDEHCDDWKWW